VLLLLLRAAISKSEAFSDLSVTLAMMMMFVFAAYFGKIMVVTPSISPLSISISILFMIDVFSLLPVLCLK